MSYAKIYSEKELAAFDKVTKQEKYRKRTTTSEGKELEFFDEMKFLQDNNAIDYQGRITINVLERGDDKLIKSIEHPPKYQLLTDLISQWNEWIGKNKKQNRREEKKVEGYYKQK